MTTTPLALEAEIIEVPVPADVRVEWVTATVPVHDWIVTSWVQSTQTYRHGLYDMRTGEWRVLAGLRGILTDAMPLSEGRALVLTEYALAEVDLDALRVIRTLSGKATSSPNYLRRIDADNVAVGNRMVMMESIASLADLTVHSRRRRAPGALVELPAKAVTAGAYRPLHHDDGVLLAASGHYPGVDQELMVFDAESLTLRATAPFPDGLASARTIPGAIIAAGPNMGRAPRIARLPWSGAE